MSVLKKLAGQTVIYGSSTILARLLNLALTPLYTNIFENEVYGIYTNLYAYVAFVNVVLTFGMETTFFRYINDKANPQHIYNQASFWVGLMAIVFVTMGSLLASPIANGMDYAGQEHLIYLLITIIFLDVTAALPLAKLRHEERIKWFAIITLMNVVVSLAGNFIFVYGLRWGIEYVFVANVIASTVRLGMAWWKNLPTSLRPDWKVLRNMLDYAFFIMIAGFAGIMNQMLDKVLIPKRWIDGEVFEGMVQTGKSLVGLYGAAFKVVMLIGLATQAFRYAAEPFFFKEASNKNSPETFAKVFHFFMLAALMGFLLIASFTKEIFAFNLFGIMGDWTFVGREYWVSMHVVPILLLAYVLSAAYINISIWFKITKQTRFAILFTGAGALITIAGNYFGIPIYGYYASAWSALACYALMVILVYLVGQTYYPIPYRIGRILLYSVLFIAAWLLNRKIGPTDGFYLSFIAKTFVCLVCAGIVYLAEKYYPSFPVNDS